MADPAQPTGHRAAARLADTGMPTDDYLAVLGERAGELLAHGLPVTYPTSLAVSTQWALDRVADEAPAALDLLILAAQLGPEPIPLILFTTHLDQLPDPLGAVACDPLVLADLTRRLRQRGWGCCVPLLRTTRGTSRPHGERCSRTSSPPLTPAGSPSRPGTMSLGSSTLPDCAC